MKSGNKDPGEIPLSQNLSNLIILAVLNKLEERKLKHKVLKVAERPGYNFTILPPMAFYPAGWNRIGGFFKKSESNAETRWVNAKLLQPISGETYGIHVWNRQSSRFSIEEGSIIMGRLISDNCVIWEYK
ncbi:hypothetical protein NC651_015711 [Populus alba x Populus x berolinensis]|nr:hypothetical protein NC651_015711 [Populus alba x Populus x berolinensis]